MHSPNNYPGPALNMHRTSLYGYPEPTSPPRDPPPSKILQSILNFHHSNYMHGTPPRVNSGQEHSEVRREEPREVRRPEQVEERRVRRPEQVEERRDRRDWSSSTESQHDHVSRITPQNYHHHDVVRHRVHSRDPVSPPCVPHPTQRHDQVSSPYLPHPIQREMPYLLPMPNAQNDPQLALSRYYQGSSPTATATQSRSRDSGQPYPENYLSPRNRSSSIGSAGSSFRDSRSPSHDSTASRDSMSRCSPMSIGSSPSPSPPTQDTGSKLLGILKGGSYNYSYNSPPARSLPSPVTQPRLLARSHSSHSSVSETVTSGSLGTALKLEPPSPQYTYRHPVPAIHDRGREKREIRECQDEPIDLSVKPKRPRLESTDNSASPSADSGWGSDYFAPDDSRNSPSEGTPRKSILESILSGKLASVRDSFQSNSNSPIPRPGFEYPYSIVKHEPQSPRLRDEHSEPPSHSSIQPRDSPCSLRPPQSPPASMPPSPAPSIGSQISILSTRSRCPWRQRVTLAKKNLLPVSARVSDWLGKIVDFAKSQPEFSGLPESDKVTLMQHCWTRLMLLFMAETNFQFAVTPVHEYADDGRPPAISGIDPTEPTMDSVELVQNFIKKCQALQVDSEDFKCLKMYTLFHSGN